MLYFSPLSRSSGLVSQLYSAPTSLLQLVLSEAGPLLIWNTFTRANSMAMIPSRKLSGLPHTHRHARARTCTHTNMTKNNSKENISICLFIEIYAFNNNVIDWFFFCFFCFVFLHSVPQFNAFWKWYGVALKSLNSKPGRHLWDRKFVIGLCPHETVYAVSSLFSFLFFFKCLCY